MKTAEIKIEPNLHAHRCEACFRNGVTTVWVHDNSHGGDAECVKVAASHTCPRCGSKEWVKWLLPVGTLPEQKQQQPFVRFVSLETVESILATTFWLTAILALVYLTYIVVKGKKETA